eukprot:6835088-Lingulodinium_polyedra.AAC.1
MEPGSGELRQMASSRAGGGLAAMCRAWELQSGTLQPLLDHRCCAGLTGQTPPRSGPWQRHVAVGRLLR